MVHFNIKVVSYIVGRSKTKQFIKVINFGTLTKICNKDFFYWWLCSFVVAAVVVAVVAVFVAGIAVAEFDVGASADVAVAVFQIVFVVLVLFVVAAFVLGFETHDGDFVIAWEFCKIFADYFGDVDHVIESAVYWLYLGILVDLEVLL